MSEAIRRMLADRAEGEQASEAGLRRELVRQLVQARKAKFVAAFERQQRYYRMATGRGPQMLLDPRAECEAVHLAMDPGWGAERAWQYSETRQACVAEVEAEIERRREQSTAVSTGKMP